MRTTEKGQRMLQTCCRISLRPSNRPLSKSWKGREKDNGTTDRGKSSSRTVIHERVGGRACCPQRACCQLSRVLSRGFRAASLPLPTRNEWGEDQGEGLQSFPILVWHWKMHSRESGCLLTHCNFMRTPYAIRQLSRSNEHTTPPGNSFEPSRRR